MAKISTPPVPAKLYKHFAAVTITLTAAIAMFADADQRAAANTPPPDTVVTRQVEEIPRYGRAILERAEGGMEGSFGGDNTDGGYGQPMIGAGGDNRSAIVKRPAHTGRQPLPNMTPEEVAALSVEEYERLRALYVRAGVIEDVDRSAQMSEIEAASARRAGHSGSDR
ncbi:hypothetical protein [Aurantiacibacter rhizosphaerae]|uniref:Uncharacterized protein n=1 Tax=Aurantiacibacter rhizosphaerae TaxID=2691582 RepID=A0A844XF74_9SPHN|nr:hypothetical protein [Aurantiacibacter rhizosphaerae]MWV28155.1 hypothetical protein [Aurantiacibacter rhizosphaerae]